MAVLSADRSSEPRLQSLLEDGEDLLLASRFVGDEEDFAFWQIRRGAWASRLPAECAAAHAHTAAARAAAGRSLSAALSAELSRLQDALAILRRLLDDARRPRETDQQYEGD